MKDENELLVLDYDELTLEERFRSTELARQAGYEDARYARQHVERRAGRPGDYYNFVVVPALAGLPPYDAEALKSQWRLDCRPGVACSDPRVRHYISAWNAEMFEDADADAEVSA